MTVTIFGIKHCDTMKKAFTWLSAHHIDYTFVDYTHPGVIEAHIAAWCKAVGWETLLNKKGLTWKKLTDAERADIDESKAVMLLTKYPTMIKRPVLSASKQVLVGFSPEIYQLNLR